MSAFVYAYVFVHVCMGQSVNQSSAFNCKQV